MANIGGQAEQILEVACDMSEGFLSGVAKQLPSARITVNWFYIVQIFTWALDEVHEALQTLRAHAERVLRRWTATYTKARLESLNGDSSRGAVP